MNLPSKIFVLGLCTGWSLTISVIALLAVADPAELTGMTEDLIKNDSGTTIISCVVFGVFGLIPLLIEIRRKRTPPNEA